MKYFQVDLISLKSLHSLHDVLLLVSWLPLFTTGCQPVIYSVNLLLVILLNLSSSCHLVNTLPFQSVVILSSVILSFVIYPPFCHLFSIILSFAVILSTVVYCLLSIHLLLSYASSICCHLVFYLLNLPSSCQCTTCHLA